MSCVALARGVVATTASLLASLALFGCIAVIPYSPDEGAVERLGPPEAKRRLAETVARAQDPHVSKVEVSDDCLTYQWSQVIHGAYGIPVGSTLQSTTIYFANVSRLEIYENFNTYIYGPGSDQLTAKILFQNEGDAKLFVDLMASYRARRLSGGGGR